MQLPTGDIFMHAPMAASSWALEFGVEAASEDNRVSMSEDSRVSMSEDNRVSASEDSRVRVKVQVSNCEIIGIKYRFRFSSRFRM